MFRMPQIKLITYAMLTGIVSAVAGIAWLFGAVITQGGELSAVKDITLDLLIGTVIFLTLGWLVLRYQSRGRQRYQQEIDERQQKLDSAVTYMSQGLVMFDPAYRIVFCNRRYTELYGLSHVVVKPGLHFRELLLHRKECGSFFGDVDEYYNTLIANIAKAKPTHLITKGSNGRTLRIVKEPLPGGGWVATHDDVTERQHLLKSLERSTKIVGEQKLQLDAALDNMIHGLCMYDREGRIVLFNRRYREMMGHSAEDLRGLSLLDLLKHRKTTGALRGDPDELFAHVMTSMRAGKTTIDEMVWVDDVVLRVANQPMEGGGWVASFEDVTERRRTERERNRNRAFLDLIIDNIPSAIFVKNSSDGRYVLVNRAGEKFWGLSRDDMIGKTAAEILPSAEAEMIAVRDRELLQSGGPVFDEREILTRCDGVRSIHSRRLPIRDSKGGVSYVLGVVDDVTDRKAAEAKIAQLAHYDPLTNLANRTLFHEQLEKELSFVRRGAQLAVLYLDLDNFKSINDTLGHPAGDELLKAVALRLRSCLRGSDLIARLGGDEFAIVRTQLEDPKDAAVLAQRLHEAVSEVAYDLNGHHTTTDVSIGIALSPDDGTKIDDLVMHADLALYGAKTDGRATYRYFEPKMNARMRQRRKLEIDLRSALTNDQLKLHYQPIVNLRTGTVVECEALLRWDHPERGIIPPLEFIPAAEETGLINAIGDWVLRKACLEAMKWPSHVSVAVNVSPVQFRNSAFALTVVGSLASSGLSANRLELEITESVLMQNNVTTLATLHKIRGLGVRVALDDFGTGYSSLSYLRSFPFDKIKIDRSFIDDLSKSENAVAIVHAILSLASSLRMTTTAEGVETVDQKRMLQAAGCDEIQGYLFSVPRTAIEIAELLISNGKLTKVA